MRRFPACRLKSCEWLKTVVLLVGLMAAYIGAFPTIACSAQLTGSSPISLPAEKNVDQTLPGTIDGPRDLFRALGVDDRYFSAFANGKHMGEEEQQSLLRILFRLSDFPLLKVATWAHRVPIWDSVAEQPDDHRGEIFAIRGQVVQINLQPLEPGAAALGARLGINSVYRCELLADESQRPLVVYVKDLPQDWTVGRTVDYSTSLYGFFVRIGEEVAGTSPLEYAAQRLAWHPNTELGRLGMDYGLFSSVRNGAGIRDVEAECFYQMLAAVGKDTRNATLRSEPDNAVQADLLTQPGKHHGDLFTLRGTARRAIEIQVTDRAAAKRFGFDHYFEIDVFVDLGQTIVLGEERFSTYPFTVCVRDLPDGMPTGEKINEQVAIAAYFFKLWSYRSPLMQQANARQPSPLLVGRIPVWNMAETSRSQRSFGYLAGTLLVVALLGIGAGLWLSRDRDHRTAARLQSSKAVLPDSISLQNLDQISSDEVISDP